MTGDVWLGCGAPTIATILKSSEIITFCVDTRKRKKGVGGGDRDASQMIRVIEGLSLSTCLAPLRPD